MKYKITAALSVYLLSTLSPLQAENYDEITQEERAELPSDFLRDVMMPVGIPFLSFFHAARESLFLNTHISKTTNPLEAVGDFFLTPSRYLFAGKRIQLHENQVEVKQHFSYKRKHWLKSIFATAALPASYTLGATFKGCSYLSARVRHKHRDLKKGLLQIKPNIATYHDKGVASFYSDEEIPCLHHNRPSGLTHNQRIEIQALKDIASLLNANEIPYWLECGSCLGAYRYGGIIPWDWDIDIGIIIDDHDNVKQLLSTLDPKKYQIQDWSSYQKPKSFMKLYVKETKNFIDIYHYKLDEQEQKAQYVFSYEDSPFPHSWKVGELKCTKPLSYDEMFPLKKAHFDGLTVWAPHNTVAFLQSKYGENLEPTMVWIPETKSYEKVEGHPYFQ